MRMRRKKARKKNNAKQEKKKDKKTTAPKTFAPVTKSFISNPGNPCPAAAELITLPSVPIDFP